MFLYLRLMLNQFSSLRASIHVKIRFSEFTADYSPLGFQRFKKNPDPE